MTTKHGWGYIDNSAIDSERHLVSDGLHLNHAGVMIFATSLVRHINQPIHDDISPADRSTSHHHAPKTATV